MVFYFFNLYFSFYIFFIQHLRSICNIYWPSGVISNKELYRRCKTLPITKCVRKSTWTLLGHILRSDDNTPASLALRYAISSLDHFRGRVGRPRSNLLNTIQNDLKEHCIVLNTLEDLENLKFKAYDRVAWKTCLIIACASFTHILYVFLQDLLTH